MMRSRHARHNQRPPEPSPLGAVLHHDSPLPPKPAELTWRDYLIMLLHIAAELEQSLMVQYLYAAYSLGGEQASEHEAKVQEWRDAILGVAREEMGHLLTVQNVLCLLGGPISFEREDYPWDTPYYPYPFRLEPLTLESLAKYVFAEMPPSIRSDDGPDGRTAAEAMRLLGDRALGHPVGEVYDQIIDIIANPRLIPDALFNTDSYARQASFEEWGRNYRPAPRRPHASPDEQPEGATRTRLIIARMASRTETLAALRDVAGQGEAPEQRGRAQAEPSHFDRFAKVFRELQALQTEHPGWSPTRPVPVNPVISIFQQQSNAVPDPALELTPITAEPSRTWASLFNVRYRMLLTYLSHTYHMPRPPVGDGNGIYSAIVVKIFGEMYNLKTLAGILVRCPLGDPDRPERAGPTFQMPYTLAMPTEEADCWRQHLDLVLSSQELVAELLHPDKNNLEHAPPDGVHYLKALRDLDAQSVVFINRVLEGLRPIRRTRA
jgi:hypothetical protein